MPLVTEDINLSHALITNAANDIIKKITNNINLIYKQVKRNEKTPNTDYLFNGLNENNIEKTMKKLETINIMLNN